MYRKQLPVSHQNPVALHYSGTGAQRQRLRRGAGLLAGLVRNRMRRSDVKATAQPTVVYGSAQPSVASIQ